ncbi:LysR family transcriptional regulator [Neiella marina]|uniref:LysR family transcriptional regulator n=1 Tax=Neiella holothuriorum TaxID=2870530 RepID=A0ABS7EEG2_9GAMM|nr:LysR family transcriptional regulator [Neiella holothuriorum]MBW8190625.1 LysR family transcriptional regulator [Neiella holothuriorum]
MALTIEQLLTIKAAADCGSFSAAARKLGKAQSTVSATINNLEQETGVVLFDRSGRYPTLTEAGQGIVEHIATLLAQVDNLEGKFNASAVGIESELTLVVDAAIPYDFLAPTLNKFYQEFPYVTLHVEHPNLDATLNGLVSEHYVLALMLTQPNYPDELKFHRLGNLKMAEVAQAEHPLCQIQPVTFADLSSYRQIIFSPHGRNLVTAEYLRSSMRLYIDNYATLIQMTLDGLGWSVVPESMVAPLLEKGELVELLLESYPHTKWEVGIDLVWSRRAHLGLAAQWLQRDLSSRSANTSKTMVSGHKALR